MMSSLQVSLSLSWNKVIREREREILLSVKFYYKRNTTLKTFLNLSSYTITVLLLSFLFSSLLLSFLSRYSTFQEMILWSWRAKIRKVFTASRGLTNWPLYASSFLPVCHTVFPCVSIPSLFSSLPTGEETNIKDPCNPSSLNLWTKDLSPPSK